MKIKIEDKPYAIPTNWSQVKYSDFANSKTEGISLEEKLMYQTTIPKEILSNLPNRELAKLIQVVEFWDEPIEFFEPYVSDMNVGNDHYIKMEQSRAAMKGNPWTGIIEVVRIYTGQNISELNVTKAYGIAAFFLSSCERSWQDTSSSESTRQTKMKQSQE